MGGHPPVELGGVQIDPIGQLVLAEADGEGHDRDAVGVDDVLGQVARAVGDEADASHSVPPGSGGTGGRRSSVRPGGWRGGYVETSSGRRGTVAPGASSGAGLGAVGIVVPTAAAASAAGPPVVQPVPGPPDEQEGDGAGREDDADAGDRGRADRVADLVDARPRRRWCGR